MIVPVLIGQIAPGTIKREFLNAFLCQYAHVDLEAHQGEH